MTALDGLLAGAFHAPHAEAPLLLLGAGLLVGLYHALEPDHVTAVMSSVRRGRSGEERQSGRTAGITGSVSGLLWGFGHASSIFLVAVLVIILSVNIPHGLFDIFEMGVGAMLILLGVSAACGGDGGGTKRWALPFLSRLWTHSHVHTHEDGTTHSHPHGHDGRREGGSGGSTGHHSHSHVPYIIGCVHGLAGSGGLVVLALSSMPDAIVSSAADAGALLPLPLLLASVFGAGSTIGMVLVAGALSLLFAACGSTNTARKIIRYASGGAAILFGAYIIASGVAAALGM